MLYIRAGLLAPVDGSAIDVDKDEIGWLALGPTIVVTALSTIVVALRWYTRTFVAHCIGKDDFIILLSLILAWAMCIIMGFEYNVGFGDYTSSTVDKEPLTKLIIVNNNIWALATNITKASIIAQYLRIFSSPMLRYICTFILSLLLFSACWAVFAGTFLCTPVQKLWQPEIPGRCMDALTYWMAAAGVNSGLDLVVLILPLPWLFGLRLPRRQKVCIMTLFMLGLLVNVVSSIRFATVFIEAQRGDHIRSGMYAILWSAVEVNIGIICASSLALKPLIVLWFPALIEPSRMAQSPQETYERRSSFREVFVDVTREEGYTEITFMTGDAVSISHSRNTSDTLAPDPGLLGQEGVKVKDYASEDHIS